MTQNCSTERPVALAVRPEGIPPELKLLPRWVRWRYVWREDKKGAGKWTKPPYQPGGPFARSNDPATWSSFEDVYPFDPGAWDGIGFMLGDDHSGVDFDKCRSPETGRLTPWAADALKALDSYGEVSPSSTGAKVLVRGKKPAGWCKKSGLPSYDGGRDGAVEMYSETRYFTVTGHVIHHAPVADRQDELLRLHAGYEGNGKAKSNGKAESNGHLTDEQVLMFCRSAVRSKKFADLFDRGDLSPYPEYANDRNRADLGLCSLLYRGGASPEQIDVLFRRSALYREEKWGRRKDYRDRTIKKAVTTADEDQVGGDQADGAQAGAKPKAKKERGPSPATVLTQAALQASDRLFLCGGKAYLRAGPLCFAVSSTPCRRWLTSVSLRQGKGAPSDNTLKVTAQTLDAVAHEKGEEGEVHRRFARVGNIIYVDLADAESRHVEVTAAGWKVGPDCPANFLRHPNQRPQVLPAKGSGVRDLFRLMNVAPEDWPLLLGFLLDCFKARGPYCVLLINGEQGSAKSTFTKMLRMIVDPVHKAAARHLQRDVMELSLAAEFNYAMAYDNVSSLPQWLSDALASLATGSGFGCRKFHCQDEEVIFGDARPIIINGIPDFAESPDLLDRAIKVTMRTIAERRTDEEVWAAFMALLPGVLAELLDMVAKGLANEGAVTTTNLPRIASSAKWIAACGCIEFPDAYASNRQSLADLSLDNSDLAQGLFILFDQTERAGGGVRGEKLPWEGTPTRLLDLLNYRPLSGGRTRLDFLRDSRRWPKSKNQLGTELNRVIPDLARVGMLVDRVTVNGRKLIRIRSAPGANWSPPAAPDGDPWAEFERVVG
jgi:hypothetical protein